MKFHAIITVDNEPSPKDIPHVQHIIDNDFKHRPYSIEVKEIIE